jgi:hypothetical protein
MFCNTSLIKISEVNEASKIIQFVCESEAYRKEIYKQCLVQHSQIIMLCIM